MVVIYKRLYENWIQFIKKKYKCVVKWLSHNSLKVEFQVRILTHLPMLNRTSPPFCWEIKYLFQCLRLVLNCANLKCRGYKFILQYDFRSGYMFILQYDFIIVLINYYKMVTNITKVTRYFILQYDLKSYNYYKYYKMVTE